MGQKKVTTDGASKSKFLPCIGDLEIHEDKKPILIIPGTPVVENSFSVKLSTFQVFIPNRSITEANIRTKVASNFSSNDQGKVQILSRILKIGCILNFTYLSSKF